MLKATRDKSFNVGPPTQALLVNLPLVLVPVTLILKAVWHKTWNTLPPSPAGGGEQG